MIRLRSSTVRVVFLGHRPYHFPLTWLLASGGSSISVLADTAALATTGGSAGGSGSGPPVGLNPLSARNRAPAARKTKETTGRNDRRLASEGFLKDMTSPPWGDYRPILRKLEGDRRKG